MRVLSSSRFCKTAANSCRDLAEDGHVGGEKKAKTTRDWLKGDGKLAFRDRIDEVLKRKRRNGQRLEGSWQQDHTFVSALLERLTIICVF